MSDLHVGINARSKDLCPLPSKSNRVADRKYKEKYNSKIEDDLRSEFYRFLEEEEIHADYLVLPGDLTNTGHPNEVKIASAFIEEVAEKLGVESCKILFTPGNHDTDWDCYDEKDLTGIKWEQRYCAIGHKNYCFRKQIALGDGDLFGLPYFTIWRFADLLAVSYNSASHDSPMPKNKIHHGHAIQEYLDKLKFSLDALEISDDVIRVFIVHHHLMDFSSPFPDDADFSLMTNGENLLNLLHEMNFDLVIHGHKHHPRFETHSTKTYSYIPILCSGSFSALISTRWAGKIKNQFHLITIDGRDGENKLIKGNVKSWANHYDGWEKSELKSCGIHHYIPFGSYVMPKELDAAIEPFIKECIKKAKCVTWEEVINSFPELKYLPLDSAILSFHRIADKYKMKTMHETLKDLILYKRNGE